MHPYTELNPDALRIELAYRRALLPATATRRFRARAVRPVRVVRPVRTVEAAEATQAAQRPLPGQTLSATAQRE